MTTVDIALGNGWIDETGHAVTILAAWRGHPTIVASPTRLEHVQIRPPRQGRAGVGVRLVLVWRDDGTITVRAFAGLRREEVDA
jgi:hypothetical protein